MIEVIPAIDLMEGKCVRLKQGVFETKTTYSDNPLDLALLYQDAGCKRLHIVDLEGAKKGYPVHLELISEISRKSSLLLQSGGGIKSKTDFLKAKESGVSKIILGSMAIHYSELFSELLKTSDVGSIILGADVLNGKIMVSGWQQSSQKDVDVLIDQYLDLGLTSVLVTDIQRDGMLIGPAAELYQELQHRFPYLEIIASGGIASIKDIELLDELGIRAVVVGKALFEGKISVQEIKKYWQS